MPPRARRSSSRYLPSRTRPTTGSVTAVSTRPSVGAGRCCAVRTRGAPAGVTGSPVTPVSEHPPLARSRDLAPLQRRKRARPRDFDGTSPVGGSGQVQAGVERVAVQQLGRRGAGPVGQAVGGRVPRLGRRPVAGGGRCRVGQDV